MSCASRLSLLILVLAWTPTLADEPDRKVADFVGRYCVSCHNEEEKQGGLVLENRPERDRAAWEGVVRKLSLRQMPPSTVKRPTEAEYREIQVAIEARLDKEAEAHPDPGHVPAMRRLTRMEYANAVRDLLGVKIDATTLLPPDEASHGFDNMTTGDLSPSRLDRYLTAAQRISRLAVGASKTQVFETFRVRPDLTQEERIEGLPFGTRGGAVFDVQLPQDGTYEIQVRLARDRNEHVEGLRERHTLLILLEREEKARVTIEPIRSERDHETADLHLKARLPIKAGSHRLEITFLKRPSSLLETKRQPYQAHYNMHRHPRLTPALYQATVSGPFDPKGPGDTPSRRILFGGLDRTRGKPEDHARRVLGPIVNRIYRHSPDSDPDPEAMAVPLWIFNEAERTAGFEGGIEAALAGVLVNPYFLFKVEVQPNMGGKPNGRPGSLYDLAREEQAARLSFLLWGSIPDEELRKASLEKPDVLQAQVRRMLKDERSSYLVESFADQWLQIRNLDAITPDLRLYPDFDDNLRQAFRRETELHFEEVIREDRSVLDLIRTDHTYLNERLAKHYGIPGVYGTHFRKVALDPVSHRGGLLRQGSVLTVSSYATRTSPVIRGKWVLENLLGSPPPPPPANIPALKDNTVAANLSVRERLAEHRANPACAGCHRLMDPVGLAMENFDAVGRYRTSEEGRPVDARGGFPDGSTFVGVEGIEKALLDRPELFARTLTEKLLSFALGRALRPEDAPAVRKIVREASASNYRFSSLVLGIARSVPFQYRRYE